MDCEGLGEISVVIPEKLRKAAGIKPGDKMVQALQRLADHAKSLGANAVVSIGFDTSEMGQSMTEVLAYGTAVVVEPDTSPAQPVALH